MDDPDAPVHMKNLHGQNGKASFRGPQSLVEATQMILANDVQAMKKACDEKGADWWRHVNEDRKTRIVTAQLMAEQITTRDLLQKVLGVDPDGNKSIILP